MNDNAFAVLIRTGSQLGVYPEPGESPEAFGYRLAQTARTRRKRRHRDLVLRVVLSASLALFGIASV
jgi:hypothetical protein